MNVREIKFRTWDNVDFKMYYTGEEESIHFYFDSSGIVAERFTDIQITVEDRLEDDVHVEKLEHLQYMQFTGLLDKNSKEIYEGDIVKGYLRQQDCDFLSTVNFEHGMFKLKFDKVYGNIVYEDMTNHNAICFEVIGNIYENPELLEG